MLVLVAFSILIGVLEHHGGGGGAAGRAAIS